MSCPRQRLTSSVQVNESLLAMSFENEGKEEEEETESDTLNDSDNIDSQQNGRLGRLSSHSDSFEF